MTQESIENPCVCIERAQNTNKKLTILLDRLFIKVHDLTLRRKLCRTTFNVYLFLHHHIKYPVRICDGVDLMVVTKTLNVRQYYSQLNPLNLTAWSVGTPVFESPDTSETLSTDRYGSLVVDRPDKPTLQSFFFLPCDSRTFGIVLDFRYLYVHYYYLSYYPLQLRLTYCL